MAAMRIDKLLSAALGVSRTDAKAMLSKGNVRVNGVVFTNGAQKTDPETDEIFIGDRALNYKQYIYLIMNKPAGVVCATEDRQQTVLDLLPQHLYRPDLFPVGRLDKDTTGLLLLTNDGDFAHRVISPKSNIVKRYIVRLAEPLTDAAAQALRTGVTLADGTRCLPARVEFLTPDASEIALSIYEGKYHQVKRMLGAMSNRVTSLHRASVGALALDKSLAPGAARELTDDERNAVFDPLF